MAIHKAQAKNGQLVFGSLAGEQKFREWLKDHEGARMKITTDKPLTGQARRFFEGAVVPYFFLQHSFGTFANMKDARDCLKLEFNPHYTTKLDGTRHVSAGSTAGFNNEKMHAFVDKIIDWMREQGYVLPDSEEYKKWRDSGPLINEMYPPLKRLVDLRPQE